MKPWVEIDPAANLGDTRIEEILKKLDCTGVNLFPTTLVNQ
jgi:hypothetical protein